MLQFLRAVSFENRAALLFGHCGATEEMADYLLLRGISTAAILDNNPAKSGLFYREIPIASPEIIQNFTSENSIVLIANRYFAEMARQLRKLGYDGEILQVIEFDSFTEFSLDEDTLERKKQRVFRGAAILEKIRAEFPALHLVICPYNALGDVYNTLAFLPEYLKKNAIPNYAVITVEGACSQIPELFGAFNIASLAQNDMDEFVQAVIFLREKNAIIAHHDRPYTDNIIHLLSGKFISFSDYYKFAVFGLDNSALPVIPQNFAPFENTAEIPRNSSVILAPFAKSVVGLPGDFWEKIAADYASRGFSVYTNIAGGETPIRGTVSLTIPLKQIVPAAEFAGTFVGVRSGLCDLLTSANCNKFVVFPDAFYSSYKFKSAQFFRLDAWSVIVV